MIINIFLLLLVYQLKHFICDYPLQNSYMLGKFKEDWDFLLPLTLHSFVHAVFTFLISICIAPFAIAIGLSVFDFVIHFIMDRIKASPKYLGRFKPLNKFEIEWYQHETTSVRNQDWLKQIYKDELEERWPENKYFWWSLGLDQMVHHITHYIIILKLIGYLI